MKPKQPQQLISAGPVLLSTEPAEPARGTLLLPAGPAEGVAQAAPRASGAVLSLRDGLAILFRHKAKSAAFLAATVTAAWFFATQETAMYTSEAMLLLRQGRENATLDPTMTTGEMEPLKQEWDQAMNSEVAILRSRELTEELVDKLGPAAVVSVLPVDALSANTGQLRAGVHQFMQKFRSTSVSPRPDTARTARSAAIQGLSDAIKVEAVDRSAVIRVACTLASPVLAQRVVQEMIASYSARHVAAYSRPGSFEFFQTQTADCRKRLQQADDALRRAKNDLSIASLQIEREAIAKRIADLRTLKETFDDRLAAARVQCTELEKKVDPETKDGPAPSPETFRTRRQALQAAELAYHSLQQEAISTDAHLVAALAILKTLNNNESAVHDLQRERDVLEADYVKYSAKLEEARISVALEKQKFANMGVIQAPSRPIEANQTHALLLSFLSLLLGLGGSIGVAFVSESLDETVRRPQDLERNSLRTLASLPRLKRRHIGLRVRRPRGPSANSDPICRQTPEVARPFEALVYRTLLAMDGRTPQPTLIGITSCYPGEGVSTITRNLAVALAGSSDGGQRSLLVEPNAKQMSWLPFMGRNLGPRATEFLRDTKGDVSVIEHSIYKMAADEKVEAEEPTVLPKGELSDQELIRRARACDAGFVLFDLPPLSEGVAAERMAGWMDHVILVVESERVRWQTVSHAQTRLAEAHVGLLGAVLNKRRYHIPAWLYRRL